MASTTRGSIKLSTANEIGAALVDKLGGSGYSPSEWGDEINKFGIASVDSAPALSVLSNSAGTGEEKGSILLSTANAIGAMLNKKYDVTRGFKPKEWASAISKMQALSIGTASGAIANIQNGAKQVPVKNWLVTLPASLTGYSSIVGTKSGKNLYDVDGAVYNGEFYNASGNITQYADCAVSWIKVNPSTQYSFSCTKETSQTVNVRIAWCKSDKSFISCQGLFSDNQFPMTLTTPSNCEWVQLSVNQYGASLIAQNNWSIQVEQNATSSAFEAYTATTYTASLGRTIYGGTADIVTGEGSETHKNYTLDNLTWSGGLIGGYWVWYIDLSSDGLKLPENSEIFSGICDNYTPVRYNGVYGTTNTIALRSNGYLYVNNGSSEIEPTGKVTIELATPNDFTFEPIAQIPETEKICNFFADTGASSVDYYEAPTPYTRGTATGAVANFSGARVDLPCTKVIANIAPSVAGKSSVVVTRAGKNLFDKNSVANDKYLSTTTGLEEQAINYCVSDYIPVFSGVTIYIPASWTVRRWFYDKNKTPTTYLNNSGNQAYTPSADGYIRVSILKTQIDLDTYQIEVGSSASTYAPFTAPTSFEADLGEVVHGGSVDFVSGEVVKDCAVDTMTSTYLSGLTSDYIGYEATLAYFNSHPAIWVRNWNYQTAKERQAGGIKCACDYFPVSMNNSSIFASQYRVYFDVNGKNISSVQDFIDFVSGLEANNESLKIAFEIATPIESEITGQVISPASGVNNFWNDAGGNTEIEYFEEE